MDQRYYATNQSTNRNMSFQLTNMSPLGHLGGSRNHNMRQNQNLYSAGQHELQRSFSRQQESLTRGKKHHSSRGSIAPSEEYKKNNSQKSMKSIQKEKQQNNIMQQYMQVNRDSVEVEESIIIKKFQFSILSYLAEIALAYGLVIGLMYLITLTKFPFYLIIYVIGLVASITPWHSSNVIVFISCIAIIVNYFLKIQILTYPVIVICYFCVQVFNEPNKCKILFIPVLVVTIVWGFVVIPSLFAQFVSKNNLVGFYYVFPVFMFMIRAFIYLGYRQIKYTQYIFLQLPFFLLGLEYGVIMMTLNVSKIQFWYLLVFFTLSIINDRTQFLLGVLISVFKALGKITRSTRRKNKQRSKKRLQQNKNGSQEELNQPKQSGEKQIRDVSVLPAHTSAYCSINSIHIICLVYIFTKLPIYSPPYTTNNLSIYLQSQQFLPVVIWVLALVYQLMCLVLEKKRPDKFLVGFVENGIWNTIQRGVMLSIGFWLFYQGLGIGSSLLSSVSQ